MLRTKKFWVTASAVMNVILCVLLVVVCACGKKQQKETNHEESTTLNIPPHCAELGVPLTDSSSREDIAASDRKIVEFTFDSTAPSDYVTLGHDFDENHPFLATMEEITQYAQAVIKIDMGDTYEDYLLEGFSLNSIGVDYENGMCRFSFGRPGWDKEHGWTGGSGWTYRVSLYTGEVQNRFWRNDYITLDGEFLPLTKGS